MPLSETELHHYMTILQIKKEKCKMHVKCFSCYLGFDI